MRVFLFIIIFFLIKLVSGQTVFLKQPYDLGLITSSNIGYVDIPVKNVSDKKIFVFRTEADRRFQIFYSNKEVQPDSIIYIRVQFMPDQKGPFTEELKVHFSCYSEPKTIKITGYAQSVPSTEIPCPSFNQQSVSNALNFDFTVRVIDKETREPIPGANVIMLHNGVPKEDMIMKNDGMFSKRVDLGLYYFVSNAEGYHTSEFIEYVNRKHNYVLVELEADPDFIASNQPEESNVSTEIDQPEEDSPVETVNTAETESIIAETDTITEEAGSPDDITEEMYPDFPLSDYRPSNIVFLVDVSGSMKYTGKLDLLKASMIELTGMLREVDKITIVSYADNAEVLLETTSGDNKDTIISIIKSLEANGYTAGGKGMKLAYEEANKAFIDGGSNQVIMATDGAFNQGNDNPYKLAEKYNKKGIHISVVGIRNKRMDELTLQKVVRYGDGNYVKIESYDDAKGALVDEVKRSSKR